MIVKVNVHEAQTERPHKQVCRSVLILKYFHAHFALAFAQRFFTFALALFEYLIFTAASATASHFVLRAQNEY